VGVVEMYLGWLGAVHSVEDETPTELYLVYYSRKATSSARVCVQENEVHCIVNVVCVCVVNSSDCCVLSLESHSQCSGN